MLKPSSPIVWGLIMLLLTCPSVQNSMRGPVENGLCRTCRLGCLVTAQVRWKLLKVTDPDRPVGPGTLL